MKKEAQEVQVANGGYRPLRLSSSLTLGHPDAPGGEMGIHLNAEQQLMGMDACLYWILLTLKIVPSVILPPK